MQTPKSKAGTLDVPKRRSPASTPKAARQLNKPGSDADSLSSPNQASRTPKDRSPKVVQRRSPQSPLSEKKRPGRLAELETQITQLQDDLKKAKDQLNSSESWKKQAEQEAEEAKKQLLAMSAKFEESQAQLQELSASDDDRIQELRKLSQERDRAWQSELEAVQKQHSMDSGALASAMNEIQKLKAQLEMVSESEAKHEIEDLRIELENLKTELCDCKESEAQAREVLSKTEMQLDIVNATAEILRSDCLKAKEACNALALELEQSKARVQSLEGLVNKPESNLVGPTDDIRENEEDETNQLKAELSRARFEVGQLKSALEAAEIRYQEEYIQSTLQIRNAYEQVEGTKSEWSKREAQLEADLYMAKTSIEDLRARLVDTEAELQDISEEKTMELKKLESNLADLKARFMDKETELQGIAEENEMLKMEIENKEMQRSNVHDEAVALAEAARNAEREALAKLSNIADEADRSSRRAARVTEQLDAAQTANTEMEAELRRLKVQADQWRKAAEAAAAMLSTTGNNGKIVDRTGSLDSSYNNPMTMGSPYSEVMDDDSSPKKKNANMLKKIGGLWKKGHS